MDNICRPAPVLGLAHGRSTRTAFRRHWCLAHGRSGLAMARRNGRATDERSALGRADEIGILPGDFVRCGRGGLRDAVKRALAPPPALPEPMFDDTPPDDATSD